MADNVSRAIDNAGDMEALGAKTDELHTAAAQFKTTATTAKWQECRKNAQVPPPPAAPRLAAPHPRPSCPTPPHPTPLARLGGHSRQDGQAPRLGRTHGVG